MRAVVAIVLVLSGLAYPQAPGKHRARTGREYYNQLRASSKLNWFDTLVCFREKRPDTFELVGFTRDFPETAQAKQIPVMMQEGRLLFSQEDELVSTTYIKGKKMGDSIYDRDPYDPTSWNHTLKLRRHKLRLIMTIDGAGRYKRVVYLDRDPRPLEKLYGQCEAIR